MLPVLAAAGLAAYGAYQNDQSRRANEAFTKEQQAILNSVPLPVLKELHPELYKQVVQLHPELEDTVTLGPSQMEGISLDPKYKAAQMNALNKLMDISGNDGRDAQFQADAARLQNDVNTNLQGNTGAIQQNMATRGLSGGMSEMVAKQQAAQAAADRQAQMGLDLNAQAQQRALSALMNQNQVASQAQQQDFSQQSAKAQATDAISRFNAQNKQQVLGANADRTNSANQWNAQTAQAVSNLNTGLNNDTQKYNTNGLAQQRFDNQMSRATGQMGISRDAADRDAKQREREMQFYGGLASAGMQAYSANKGK